MATGTVYLPAGARIVEERIGNIGISGTAASGTLTYSSPAGYKRYPLSLHISYTTGTNYATFYTILYTVDNENESIDIRLNRASSSGSPSPGINVVFMDVPL